MSTQSARIPERRGAARLASSKTGKIVIAQTEMEIDCRIRDISATGAKLALTNPALCRTELTLRDDDGNNVACEVVWVSDTEIGVRFK